MLGLSVHVPALTLLFSAPVPRAAAWPTARRCLSFPVRWVGCRGAGAVACRCVRCLPQRGGVLCSAAACPARTAHDVGSTPPREQPPPVPACLMGSAVRAFGGARTPPRAGCFPRRSAATPGAEWCAGAARGFPPSGHLREHLPCGAVGSSCPGWQSQPHKGGPGVRPAGRGGKVGRGPEPGHGRGPLVSVIALALSRG